MPTEFHDILAHPASPRNNVALFTDPDPEVVQGPEPHFEITPPLSTLTPRELETFIAPTPQLHLVDQQNREISKDPPVYVMSGHLDDLKSVYGPDISQHVAELITDAQAFEVKCSSLLTAGHVVRALRAMRAHTKDQLCWLSCYANTLSELPKRRFCAFFGLAHHWRDFMVAALIENRPDLAHQRFANYTQLPLCKLRAPYSAPSAGHTKGTLQYWTFCVREGWPRLCPCCSRGKVFPLGLGDEITSRCDICTVLSVNLVRAGFPASGVLSTPTVEPQSMQEIVDFFSRFIGMASGAASQAAGLTRDACMALFEVVVAPVRAAMESLWTALTRGLREAARASVFGIMCLVLVVECTRRGVNITLDVMTAMLRILVCSGCSLLEGVCGIWTKVYANCTGKKRKDMYERAVEPQNDEGAVVKLLACVLMAIGPACSGISAASTIKALSSARGIMSGLSLGSDACYVILRLLPEAMRNYATEIFGFRVMTQDMEEASFLAEAFALLKRLKADKSHIQDVDVAHVVSALHDDACVLIAGRVSRKQRNLAILENVRRALQAHCTTAHRVLNLTVERPEPIMLYMESEPGCGKTYCAAALARMLAGHLPTSLAMHTHSRTAYQTGYVGQFMYHIDELGAANSHEEQAIFASLLKLVSVAQEEVPQAAVEDKGQMFTSPFILVTTNRPVAAPDSGLKYPDAFLRRCLHCKVTLDPEYRNESGQLDGAKINAKIADGSLTRREAAYAPWMRFKLSTVVFENARAVHKDLPVAGYAGELDLRTLVVYLKAKLQEKQDVFKHRVETLNMLAENCIRENEAEERLLAIAEDGVFDDALRHLPDPDTDAEEKHEEETGGDSEDDLEEFKDIDEDESLFDFLTSDDEVQPQAFSVLSLLSKSPESPRTSRSLSPVDRRGAACKQRRKERRSRSLAPARNASEILTAAERYDARHSRALAAEWDSVSDLRDCSVYEKLQEIGVNVFSAAEICAVKTRAGLEAAQAVASGIWAREPSTKMKCVRALLGLLVAGGSIAVIFRTVYKLSIGSPEEPGEPAPEQTFRSRVPKQRRPLTKVNRGQVRPITVVGQSASVNRSAVPLIELGMEACVAKAICSNFARVVTPSGSANGWFAHTSKLCLPAHLMRTETSSGFFAEGTEFSVECAGITRYLKFKAGNLTAMFNGNDSQYVDWVSYDCERVFPTKPDLTKFFCAEEEHRKLHSRKTYLVGPSMILPVTSIVRSDSQLDPYKASQGTSLLLTNRYQYKAPTRAGDCGLLLVSFSPGRAACIYGSHVAKINFAGSWAVSIPMTVSWIRILSRHVSQPEPYVLGDAGPLDEGGDSVKVPEGRNFEGFIALNMRRTPHVKSAYQLSSIADAAFLVKDRMAWGLPVLGDRQDSRCTMSQSVLIAKRKEKYGLATAIPFDPFYVQRAIDFMLTQLPTGGCGRALSWSEVLNGTDHVSAMPRSTSCGWPLKLSQTEPGKHGQVYFEDNVWHFKPDALASVEGADKAAREGRHINCVMQIIPKDEILSASKVANQDIRTVTVPPFELNALFKKYFGAYAGAIHSMAHTASHPMYIGADFYGSSWDSLMWSMKRVGAWGFDGDHGGFEYNHDSDVISAFLAHVEAYYAPHAPDEGDIKARKVLAQLMIHTRQLNQDVIFECNGEFASGLWITNLFNSCSSWFYVLAGFFAMLDQGGRSTVLSSGAFPSGSDWLDENLKTKETLDTHEFDLEFCRNNLVIRATGDDHIVAVSPTASKIFSGSVFAAFMHSHHRKYTPADKAATFGPDRPISELGFLSGETLMPEVPPIPGQQHYYSLKLSNARRQLVYVTVDAGERGLADNANSYLRSQWARGRRFFDSEKQFIQGACDDVGYEVALISYEAEWRRRQPVLVESLGEALRSAVSQSGRGFTTVHDSEDARRWLTSMRLLVANSVYNTIEVELGSLHRTHGIHASDIGTCYDRAISLCEKGVDKDCFYSMPSNGALGFTEYEGQYYCFDGNNRVAAVRLAACVLGVALSTKVTIPVTFVSQGTARMLSRVCRPGGCPFCNFDECDCVAFVAEQRRLRGLSPGQVIPEMEASVSVHDDQPAIQPTAGSDDTPDPMMAFDEDDVVNILKREGLCGLCLAPPVQYSISWPAMGALCGLLGKEDLISFTKPAAHVWWMGCYGLYTGSTRLTTHFKAVHVVTATAEEVSVDELTTCLFGGKAGLLPGEYTNEAVGFTSTQLPSLTTFGAVAIPHTYADLQRPECRNGYYAIYAEPSEATGKLFASVGDDATLSVLWRVPTLLVSRPKTRVARVPEYDANAVSAFRHKWLNASRETYTDNPMLRSHRMAVLEQEEKKSYTVLPQMEGGKGIVFDETAIVKQPTTVRNPAAPMRGIPEVPYSHVDMMSRSQHVGNITWGVQAVERTVIYQAVAPWDYFIGASGVAASRFCYFRGDLKLRFSVQSSVTQAGMLMVVAVPLKDDGEVLKDLATSWASLSVNNHCFLRAGTNSVVEMSVPFLSPSTMLLTERGQQLPVCSIIIVPVNALLVGENAPMTVEISMFSSFENCSLAVIKSPQVTPQGMGLSTLSKNVSDVVTKTIDVVGSVGQLVAQVQDRPNVGLNPTPVVRRAFPYTSNSTNVDYRHVLALKPGLTTSLSPEFSATVANETKMSYLTTLWTMFDTASFTDKGISGDILLGGSISPVQVAHLASDAAQVRESLLGYASLFHSYWTGPIELKFEFVATSFHTFRVVFCTHYGEKIQKGPVLSATQQNMVAYNYSYDDPSFSVLLPWRVAKSVLLVAGGSTCDIGTHSAGEWSLRLDTSVIAPSTVTNTVRVNLHIRGGPGFRLHGAYEGSLQYTPC